MSWRAAALAGRGANTPRPAELSLVNHGPRALTYAGRTGDEDVVFAASERGRALKPASELRHSVPQDPQALRVALSHVAPAVDPAAGGEERFAAAEDGTAR